MAGAGIWGQLWGPQGPQHRTWALHPQTSASSTWGPSLCPLLSRFKPAPRPWPQDLPRTVWCPPGALCVCAFGGPGARGSLNGRLAAGGWQTPDLGGEAAGRGGGPRGAFGYLRNPSHAQRRYQAAGQWHLQGCGQPGDRVSLLPVTGGGAHGSRGLPVSTIIDVDLVTGSAPGPGRRLPGLWAGPRRSELPGRSPGPGRPTKPKASPHHATFV